jgi:hypothetical protein
VAVWHAAVVCTATVCPMQWEDWEGDGWYIAESGGLTATINTNARRIEVYMSAPDASDFDLTETHKLFGGLGMAFPATSAELACAILTEDLGAFTANAVRHLVNLISPADLDRLVLTPGYGRLLAAFGTVTGSDMVPAGAERLGVTGTPAAGNCFRGGSPGTRRADG